jgi:calcium/proton exchanger cax
MQLTHISNAVQLILSVLLLKSRQINVLKYSLIGAILSHLLLTTGLSFFFRGLQVSGTILQPCIGTDD